MAGFFAQWGVVTAVPIILGAKKIHVFFKRMLQVCIVHMRQMNLSDIHQRKFQELPKFSRLQHPPRRRFWSNRRE